MKKKLLLPLSTLLLAGIALSSCAKTGTKTTETTAEETEETETTETEETTEETTTEETTAETTEETTTETSEAVIASDAPIVVNWDNYQSAGAKPSDSNKFTRYSDEYINGFMPMDDYGAIFPFLATSSLSMTADSDQYYYEDDYVRFDSYGLCDSQGRIICDSVYSGVQFMDDLLCLSIGEYPDKKFGLADMAGTKFTQIVYDHIDRSKYGIYARAGNELTVYDNDLNVVMRTPFNINYDSFIYGPTDEYAFSVYRVLDQEHCILDFGQGMLFKLNMSTGEISQDYISLLFNDPNIMVGSNEEGCFLMDTSGNRLSDVYESAEYTFSYPIFMDEEGNRYALDSQGQVIKELGKLNGYKYIPTGDYLLIVSPDGHGTLYDKDFNEITTTEGYGFYVSNISGGEAGSVPYIVDKKNVINGLTGEVLIENVGETDGLYVAGDNVVAYGYSYGTTYLLPGNRQIRASAEERSDITYDPDTDTVYVVVFMADHTEIYNSKTDSTIKIDQAFKNAYTPVVRNGVIRIYGSNITKLYDLNTSEEIFSYAVTDPIGD